MAAQSRIWRLRLRVFLPTLLTSSRRSAGTTASSRLALVFFNDVILRTVFESGVGVIDLRLVCTQPSDNANSIEPSGAGGERIAGAIFGRDRIPGWEPPVSSASGRT
jgi:hypothetical protein